ncbi:MAG: RDD family protein [Myxococcota bacterium]
MADNPYQAPSAPLLDVPRSPNQNFTGYPDASVGTRFLNYVVDIICIQFLGLVVAVALIVFAPEIDIESAWVNYAIGIPNFLIYYFLMEWMFGRTIGKLVTGTRVVGLNSPKPSPGALLGRSFARLVPFEPFSCFDGNGWHDQWSGTRVVKVRGKTPTPIDGLS